MDLRVGLAQKQKLNMTLHMQQMIKFLQLSSAELCHEVSSMLEACVLLEMDDSSTQPIRTSYALNASDFGQEIENYSQPDTLSDYLFRQLALLSLTPLERVIGEVLIDGINDKGYLTVMPDEVHSLLSDEVDSISDVLLVLQKIQDFEPAGIAARTQQECLSLQLERMSVSSTLKSKAFYLLESCFYELIDNDQTSLRKKTGWSASVLTSVVDVIRSLNPFPGWIFSSVRASYCVPDVIILKQDEQWCARLNREVSPVLRVNSQYVKAVNAQLYSCSKKETMYWREQLKDARCFVRGLNNRYSTLLQVMRVLLVKQYDFLERGVEGMRSLSMRCVAEILGVHESTVSRVGAK